MTDTYTAEREALGQDLARHAQRYRKGLRELEEQAGPVFDGDGTRLKLTGPVVIASARSRPASSWDRVTDRLNANLPGAAQ